MLFRSVASVEGVIDTEVATIEAVEFEAITLAVYAD